jgi:peptidoglycan/LPS O-acetylase OafA/YrhL
MPQVLDLKNAKPCQREGPGELGFTPMPSLNSRIPALDGWRGIAITLVLVDHLQQAFLGHYFSKWSLTGQHGVTFFFVLSGYLITARLLDGKTSLSQFYIRRAFRLMPVVWIYIGAVLAFEIVSGVQLSNRGEAISCLFFYRNYFLHASVVFGHFWTLSIEEQFYLVWPTVLLLLGLHLGRRIATVGIIISALLRMRFANYYMSGYHAFQTEVRADALLCGCLLALLMQDEHIRSWIERKGMYVAVLAGTFISYCMLRFPWPTLPESLSIAVLIAVSVMQPECELARALSWRPLTWLGLVSYSLYVWQDLILLNTSGWATKSALIFVVALMSITSYYLIERPMTRIGRRATTGYSALCIESE